MHTHTHTHIYIQLVHTRMGVFVYMHRKCLLYTPMNIHSDICIKLHVVTYIYNINIIRKRASIFSRDMHIRAGVLYIRQSKGPRYIYIYIYMHLHISCIHMYICVVSMYVWGYVYIHCCASSINKFESVPAILLLLSDEPLLSVCFFLLPLDFVFFITAFLSFP